MDIHKQLYLTDSYLRHFSARVLRCEPCEQGFAVVLDRTAFFPEGGGQPADTGLLGEARVLDVQEEGDVIVHITDRPLTCDSMVPGSIDWARRLDHMQQHTGEHIVSGIVHQLFGYDNVGFRLPPLGKGLVSVDFNGILTEDDLREVENRSNALIASDVELGIAFPPKEALDGLEYRSKKEIEGQVRLIAIPGADLCACCGTHVNRSGEVQLVKIISHEKNQNGTRLFLAAGWRALHDYSEKQTSVHTLSVMLKSAPSEVVTAVRRLANESNAARSHALALQTELFQLLAQNAPTVAPLIQRDGLSADECRRLCLLLKDHATGVCRVFSKKEDGSILYALASGDTDVRPFAKALNETCDGRGGGRPELCTGTLRKVPEDVLI